MHAIWFCFPILLSTSFALKKEIKYEVHPGFIAKRIGQIKFITSYLEIHTDLRCSQEIYQQIQRVVSKNNNLTSIYIPYLQTRYRSRFYQDENNTSPELGYITSLLDESQKKFLALSKDPWVLSHVKTQPSAHPRKIKRGLMDIGGSALQYLFGTATMNDIQKLKTRIEMLQDTRTHLYNLKEQIHNNTNTLTAITDNLTIISKYVNSSISSIELQQELLKLNIYLNLEKTISDNIYNLIRTVQNIWENAKTHNTPLNLYSYDIILELIQNSSQTLHHQPILPLNRETFYQFLTFSWSYIQENHPYILSTIIPFSEETPYEAFNIIPFPTSFNDTYSRIILHNPYPYYFLNHKTLKFTYSTSLSEDICKHSNDNYICFPSNLIHQIDYQDCILSAILSKPNTTFCNYNIYPYQLPYTLKVGNYTLISFPSPITASISCPMKQPYLGTGTLFSLFQGCTLVSENYSFKYPPHSSLQTNWLSKGPQFPEHLETSHDFLPNITSFTSELKLKSIHPHWDASLDNINKTLQTQELINIHSFSISGFSILIAIFCMAGIYYVYLKFRPNQAVPVAPPSAPSVVPSIQYTVLQRAPLPEPKTISTGYPTLEPVYSNPSAKLV